MKISIRPGKYVVAVSGGVDSASLLHALSKKDDLELLVAHVDHGIRKDSRADAKFVESLAKQYGLKFISTELTLGSQASEALARARRYEFLNKVREDNKADAIITAHHQDDLIETAMINMLRGTKRRGLSSLKDTKFIRRPLLQITKQKILEYAEKHDLNWREDPTNTDESVLRNYLRRNVLAKISSKQRENLLQNIKTAEVTNEEIDELISQAGQKYVSYTKDAVKMDRSWYIMLPEKVRLEYLLNSIRHFAQNHDVSTKQLIGLDLMARTATYGTQHPISKDLELAIEPHNVLVKAKTL
ncbi:MAG: tRNA lysidine(34) synthetase TilS [Candidatus Saccharimonadales bacterium]|nr:tRNA lysidine(34) synthetase TilS [Candidatus Saccharimonadales bacterium]